MAKQKMVIKLSLGDAKKRAKALKTAVALDGVVSVALDGEKLVVIGDGTDSVEMTALLRKKLGYADLVSVGADKKEEKKEEKKDEKPKDGNPFPFFYPFQYGYHPYAYPADVYEQPKFLGSW